MRLLNAINFWFIIVYSILNISCGGDENGGGLPNPEVQGTYQWVDFNFTRTSDGFTLTPALVDNFKGTLIINENNFFTRTVSATVVGENFFGFDSGFVTDKHFEIDTGDCRYDEPYTFDGSQLISTIPPNSCGSEIEGVMVWNKISSNSRINAVNLGNDTEAFADIIKKVLR